ncbi:MAG: hypothetical protein CMC79_02750 [Flavobacteriaceae bacterium]|nr:hypothetical protein [Flavobacteriaceae bacterium]
MKRVKLLFLISFIIYFIGQLLWTINIVANKQIFKEWMLNIPFFLFSILIIITGLKWYKQK